MAKKLPPLHPGEVLREEFLVPLKMSAGALAKACGVPRTRIERLASEQIGITADTAAVQGTWNDARTMDEPAKQLRCEDSDAAHLERTRPDRAREQGCLTLDTH